MTISTFESMIELMPQVRQRYHRLILLVGSSAVQLTALLMRFSKHTNFRYVNLNLELSSQLLELGSRQPQFTICTQRFTVRSALLSGGGSWQETYLTGSMPSTLF